ncbi:Signal transduction histidine kinase [Burkholderia sp. YR290]|jgi:signal transduction histidine kinase/ActR/RegA family two-component response regulator|nr:Signal transduction histidine kinase [Paraburkholderia hospita]SOE84207.1 Signal transduction histidine kinase [Burkholderia sp. YR290]
MKSIRNRCLTLCRILCVMLAVASIDATAQAQSHPHKPASLTVGVPEGGWPPLMIVNNGQVSGAAFDILKSVLDPSAQLRVRVFPDYASLSAAACAGSVDIVLAVQKPIEARRCLILSEPYYDSDVVVVGRASDAARDGEPPRLAGKRIAAEAGSYIEQVSHERYPDSVFVRAHSPQEGLRDVLRKEADVYITFLPVADYLLSQPEFAGLAELNRYRETESGVRFGFARRQQALRDGVDERLNALPEYARQRILSRWMTTGPIQAESSAPFQLSDEERAWLRSLPPLGVGVDSGLPPYSYVDDSGQTHGMAQDYLRYLANRLGISFVRRPEPGFAATVDALQAGTLDLVAVAILHDPALRGTPVSRPYATFPVVAVGRNDAPALGQLRDLNGKRVAVTDGGGLRWLVTGAAPQARIVVVPDVGTGMNAVAEGKADVYVDDLATVHYMLQRMHGDNLRIIGSGGRSLQTGFAVSPKLAARLMPLIDRALAALPDTERLSIQNRYFGANYELGPSWKDIALRFAPVALALLAVIAVLWRSRRVLHKEARERREAELRLIDVTSQLPATAFQYRQARNGDSRVIWLSGNTVEMFGKTSAELQAIPGSVLAAVHPEDRAALLTEAYKAEQTLATVSRELRVQRRGAFRWTRLHAVPHRVEHDDLVWTGYWSDAEEQHQHAVALGEARDAAQQASRAKSEFLAAMSHEIRTPMSAVIGLIELLAHSNLRPDQAVKVKLISQAAESLLQILNDILDYSKIEAGKIALERAPVDIRDLCTSTFSLFFWRAQEKRLKLALCIDAAIAPVVWSDGVRLRQILFNLLSNAIKFTTEGSIRLDVELAGETDGKQTIVWRVSDTGIGISQDQRARLFQPFVQAEASTTRRYGGTGLGLTISRRLVAMLGGTIGMEGEVGRGTQVEFRLPLEVNQREFQSYPLAGVTVGLRVRDASVLRSMTQALRTFGGTVAILDPNAALSPDDLPAECRLIIDDQLTAESPSADEPLTQAQQKPAVQMQVGDVPVVPTTATIKTGGYVRMGDLCYLCVYPVTLEGVAAVCNAVLHGDAELGLESAASALTPAAPRSRADALRDHALILIAEDNGINRHLLRQQLELLGCTCDTVEDGMQALKAMASADYALLITDCHMPEMDGYTLATRVRERTDDARRMSIVGLTASVGREEREECLAAGMDECLYKPAKLSDLLACLTRFAPQCLQGHSAPASDGRPAPQVDAPRATPHVAGPAAVPAAATEPGELPDLDWDAINQNFGSTGRDEKLIEIIVQTMTTDADELEGMLGEAEPAVLRQWIHRVDGAASVLRYEPLKHALQTFRASVLTGDRALYIASGEQMLHKLRQITDHVARQV